MKKIFYLMLLTVSFSSVYAMKDARNFKINKDASLTLKYSPKNCVYAKVDPQVLIAQERAKHKANITIVLQTILLDENVIILNVNVTIDKLINDLMNIRFDSYKSYLAYIVNYFK